MNKRNARQALVWDLFRPTPQQPTWQDLPLEVRQRALDLLARLLRGQVPQGPPAAHGKEVNDE